MYKLMQSIISHSLEAGNPKSKVLAVSGWGPASWFTKAIFLLSLHMVEGVRKLCGVSYKITNPICEGLWMPSCLNQMAHLQTPTYWRLGFNIWISRGHKHSVCNTVPWKFGKTCLWNHLGLCPFWQCSIGLLFWYFKWLLLDLCYLFCI